jgi:hypothetical protein
MKIHGHLGAYLRLTELKKKVEKHKAEEFQKNKNADLHTFEHARESEVNSHFNR